MAGEPESLATHEPLADRTTRHDYDRLIMLSDGVFAIAITLLALELPLPEHWDGHFASLMGGIGRPLIGYVFAFLMISAFWISNRRLMARIVKVDMPVTLLVLVQLGLVGLAPLVAKLIAEQGPTHAMSAYLLLVGTILLVTAVVGMLASFRGLIHPAVRTNLWRRQMLGFGVGALALVGIAGEAMSRGGPLNQMVFLGAMLLVAATVRLTRPSPREETSNQTVAEKQAKD